MPRQIPRGLSRQDEICAEEANETLFRPERITNTAAMPADKRATITAEAHELSTIITAICKTTAKIPKLHHTLCDLRPAGARRTHEFSNV